MSLGYVIRASSGKGRMIFDCHYGNLYVPYQPGLKYDSIDNFKARAHCHHKLCFTGSGI